MYGRNILFDAKFNEALEVAVALTRRTHDSSVAAAFRTSAHANVTLTSCQLHGERNTAIAAATVVAMVV